MRKKSDVPKEFRALMGARRFGYVFKPRYRDPKTGQMRESSFWCVAYRHPPLPNGKTRTVVSSKSTDQKDAERLRWKLFADLWEHKLPWIERDPDTFFEILALAEADYIKNKRRSIARLRQSVANMKTFSEFKDLRAPALTEEVWDRYIIFRQKAGAANATINRERSVVTKAYKIAANRLDEKLRPKVPRIPLLAKLKENPPKQGFFEPDQYERVRREILLGNAQSSPEDVADVVEFYKLTGWRRDEPLSLQWPQVNQFRQVITLDRADSKSDEPWELPFDSNADLQRLLARRRKRTDEVEARTGRHCPWVFHRNGKRIKTIRAAWMSACKRAGIPLVGKGKRTPHDFRRTVARDLVDADVDGLLACDIVGWKSLQMLERYRIVKTGDRSRAMAKLKDLHDRQREAAQLAISFEEGKRNRRSGARGT